MAKKVVVAGHICLDITPAFREQKIECLGDFLTPGKLINVNEAHVNTGGCVTNTGLTMKILGADVTLAGKVGDDVFGDMVHKMVSDYHANDSLIVGKGEFTSYSVILAIPGIDRILLHHTGANDTFMASDISDEILKDAALFHFGYPPLMKSMYVNNGDELIRLMEKVKQSGAAFSMDMAAVEPGTPAAGADWRKILERCVPYTDFFLPSVEELCYMLDQERLAQWRQRAAGGDITEVLDPERDIRPLAEMCMELGAKVLVIKCGALGMYYRTADRDVLGKIPEKLALDLDAWADREGFEASYVPDRILSGTGSGDTCIGAFLTAVLQGYGLEDCIHLSAATGASCVAAYDSLSGLKSFEELNRRIKNGWKKRQL